MGLGAGLGWAWGGAGGGAEIGLRVELEAGLRTEQFGSKAATRTRTGMTAPRSHLPITTGMNGMTYRRLFQSPGRRGHMYPLRPL